MERKYRSKDGHYYIVAVQEGDSVRWSREGENDHDIDTLEDFQNMIKSEGWTEEE